MTRKRYMSKKIENTKKNVKKTLEKELRGKNVLVTGGAGSVGSFLVRKLLKFPVKSIRVFDMDEYALFKLNRALKDKRLRFLLGNILDKERLEMAGNNVDIIFHLAAVKNLEISEFNPIQTADININGTSNLISMAMRNKPKKILNISTDKAADSSTLYGTTKQVAERLISWAGIHNSPTIKFASARFGNVIESRGNVFEIWNEEVKNGKPLSITNPEMERYFFHIDEAVDFILECLPLTNVGEIFVPKMKKYKIKDLAKTVSKKQKIIGLRQGEKMSEILITNEEKTKAVEKKNMWIIKNYDRKGNNLK